jgi:hypothetical protein
MTDRPEDQPQNGPNAGENPYGPGSQSSVPRYQRGIGADGHDGVMIGEPVYGSEADVDEDDGFRIDPPPTAAPVYTAPASSYGPEFLEYLRSDRLADWLLLYVGRNPQAFAGTFQRIKDKGNRFLLSWSWAAFFFSYAWFFHRRMWLVGFVFMFIPGALAQAVPGGAGGGFLLASPFLAACLAKGFYLSRGIKVIQAVDRTHDPDAEKARRIASAGGTSMLGAIFGGIFIASSYIVIAYLALILMTTGHLDMNALTHQMEGRFR